MKKDKCVIVIGGNRANNYETFAPIVYDLKTNGYNIITFFQDKKIKNLVEENQILNNVFEEKKIISKKNFSLLLIIKLIYELSRYRKGLIITNRYFNSIKFKLFIKILKIFNFKTVYTKSFSRPPTKNIYALVGAPSKIKNKSNLSEFCILPTKHHVIEYALLGFRYNQMIISGYPKMNIKWVQYCSEMTNLTNISNFEILIVVGIYHDNFEKVLTDLFLSINKNFKNINICFKPHPTNDAKILNTYIKKFSINNNFFSSNQNVMSLSKQSKLIIIHGTSASIDAFCVNNNVYCYWGEEKEKVDEYINNIFYDQNGFDILESNLLSKPFIKSDLFTINDLDDLFRNLDFKKFTNVKNTDLKTSKITYKIEEKVFQ